LQRLLQRTGIAEPRVWVITRGAIDHSGESAWKIRTLLLDGSATPCTVRVAQHRNRRLAHGISSRCEVMQQYADAVHLTAYGRWPPFEHFRREVHRCANQITGTSKVERLPAGSEIGQDDASIAIPDDVLALYVSMQQPGTMDGAQSAADCCPYSDQLVRGEWAIRCELLLERSALHELHPDTDASSDPFRPVDRYDVRVTDAREQTSLLDNGRLDCLAVFFGIPEQLQGDVPVEPGIVSAVDVAVRPSPNEFAHLQMAPFERGFDSLADRLIGAQRLVSARDAGHQAQLLEPLADLCPRDGIDGLPVAGLIVRERIQCPLQYVWYRGH
jgi:hypothetical protein